MFVHAFVAFVIHLLLLFCVVAVCSLREIAKGPRVVAITWGCEDLSTEIGASSTRNVNNEYLPVFEYVRSTCLLAAKAANVQAIDGVYTNIHDTRGLMDETNAAR